MAYLLQRDFTTTCPGDLIRVINDDVLIEPELLQLINNGSTVTDFWFDSEVDTPAEDEFDLILDTWDCAENPGPIDPDTEEIIEAIDHKRDKIAGMINRSNTWLDFNFSTGELTLIPNPNIVPAISEFGFWSYNHEFKSSGENIIISPDGINILVYFDSAGELTYTTDTSDDDVSDNASIIARISVNLNLGTFNTIADLRFEVNMSPETRSTFVNTIGSTYKAGLALENITPDGAGDNDVQAQFSVEDGEIFLADISYSTVSRAQSLIFPAQIPVFYKMGAEWKIKTADDFPLIYSGSVGSDYAGSRLPFNEIAPDGTATLVEVADDDYVNVHYFATPGLYDGIIGVHGQAQYPDEKKARDGAEDEVSNLLVPRLAKIYYTPIGSVIYKTKNTYTNTPKAAIVTYHDNKYGADRLYLDLRYYKAALGSGAGLGTYIVDNLDSVDSSSALSANMGNELDTKKQNVITGFDNIGDVTLGFDAGTGVLSITPTGTEFNVWVNETKFTFDSAQTYTVPTTELFIIVYFDIDGVLKSTPYADNDDNIILNNAVVCTVLCNIIDGTYNQVLNLISTTTMPPSTRRNLIEANGVQYQNGFAIADITVNADGSLAGDAQFSVTDGVLGLADVYRTSSTDSQTLTNPAQIPVLYYEDTAWKNKPSDDYPFIQAGSVTGASGTRMSYNRLDESGSGILIEVENNYYTNVHYFITPGLNESVIAILGIREYKEIEDAVRGGLTELQNIFKRKYFIDYMAPIGTVLYQTSNDYTNTTKTRIVDIPTESLYIDSRHNKSPIVTSGGLIPSFKDSLFSVYHEDNLYLNFDLDNLMQEENQTVKWYPSEFDIDFRTVPDYGITVKASTVLAEHDAISLDINGNAQVYPTTGTFNTSLFTTRTVTMSTFAYQSSNVGIVAYIDGTADTVFLKTSTLQPDGSIIWGTEVTETGFVGNIVEFFSTPMDADHIAIGFVTDANILYSLICGVSANVITTGGFFEMNSGITSGSIAYNPIRSQIVGAIVKNDLKVASTFSTVNGFDQSTGATHDSGIITGLKVEATYGYDDICIQSLTTTGQGIWVEMAWKEDRGKYETKTDMQAVTADGQVDSLSGITSYNNIIVGQVKLIDGTFQTFRAAYVPGSSINTPELYGVQIVGKQSTIYNSSSGINYSMVVSDADQLIILEGNSANPTVGFTNVYQSEFTIPSSTYTAIFASLMEATHAVLIIGDDPVDGTMYTIDSALTRSDNFIGNAQNAAQVGEDVAIAVSLPIVAHTSDFSAGDIFYLGPYKYQAISKHQLVVILEEVVPI